MVDGRPTTAGAVTYLIRVSLIIDNYIENINMFATKLGYYLIILGILWLRHYDPVIRFKKNFVYFDSPFCRYYCLTNRIPLTVYGLKDVPDTIPPYRRMTVIESKSKENFS